MRPIVVDTGPFIHLNQIGEIGLLKKFSSIYTCPSIISEIKFGDETLAQRICGWRNLKIVPPKEKTSPKIERIIRKFGLHRGERDTIYLAAGLPSSMILTDDLSARSAVENLRIEVHGTVGIIAYSCHNRWIPLKRAENALLLLQKRSNLFITSAIIERAITELRKIL